MATTAPAPCALSLPTEVPDSEPLPALIAMYNVFFFGGLISLVGLLVVAKLSPNVRRAAIWYTFIMAWIVYCLAYLMLVGHQQGPPPDHTRCLVQAVFVYASGPMYASSRLNCSINFLRVMFSYLGLTVQLYISCTGLLTSRPAEANHILYLLHVAPIFLYAVVVVEGFRIGSMTPEPLDNVNPDHGRRFCCPLARELYCLHLELIFPDFDRASSHILYTDKWTVLSSSRLNLVSAAAPVSCAIIFGTQEDILRAILFWRRSEAGSRVTGTSPV
ncbi:hypothetical protein CPB85DRAFT_693820 [Mucidula mucida]|nr:hypothetical protein CPB85DRAFT_693820 [Mucidula mucida]